jgi:hypothetical protein
MNFQFLSWQLICRLWKIFLAIVEIYIEILEILRGGK